MFNVGDVVVIRDDLFEQDGTPKEWYVNHLEDDGVSLPSRAYELDFFDNIGKRMVVYDMYDPTLYKLKDENGKIMETYVSDIEIELADESDDEDFTQRDVSILL